MSDQPTAPIPGKGITPEAAEALGLETTDPRIVIDSDVVDDGISDPFPTLSAFSGESANNVPPEFSTGDTIPDVGIGESGGEDGKAAPSPSSPRKRLTRVNRDSGDSGSSARDATSRPPSLDEWTNFFGKIVLRVACDWYLAYAFRGVDEEMLTDRELDRLAMTDEERKLIATPLAEISNKSKFMRKHGRTIVASGDTFQAFVVLGAWMSRVNRIANKYRPKQPRIRVNGASQNGSSGQGTQETGYSEGTTGGRVPNGFPIYRGSSG